MRMIVLSHKPCWRSRYSPTNIASDGGFPIQMRALSELFDRLVVMTPLVGDGPRPGELALSGERIELAPLSSVPGRRWLRKALFPLWIMRNGPRIWRQLRRADAIHAPIPGDVATVGILLALVCRKPLFVRHCGNWQVQKTTAERFWRWLMERTAGGRNVMLATGGAPAPPSDRNPNIQWIFSSSLTQSELAQGEPRTPPRPDAVRLNITSRQDVRKGTASVIEAVALLSEDFPGIVLDVVGDGPDLPRFEDLASPEEIRERIRFHGALDHDQVMSLLGSADVFCFPTSSSEGFPKVVLEAMSVGLPVVATQVSVLPDLVGSDAGILLPDSSSRSVADAVRSLLTDPEGYTMMSKKGVEVARMYSLESWTGTIGAVLTNAWGPLQSDG